MGYLDELKRLADAQRSRAAVDGSALERNTLTTDGVCHAAARYFSTLAQQLNVLQPVSPAVRASTRSTTSETSACRTSAPTRG